jgi:hypothetical protein
MAHTSVISSAVPAQGERGRELEEARAQVERGQQRERRGVAARQREQAQRDADEHGVARRGVLDVAHRAEQEPGQQGPLQCDGQGLVAVQQQAQAAEVDQDGRVGQRAAIVVRFRLAAEGQAQRLCFRAPAQVERRVPQRQGAQREDADGRDARPEHVAHEPAEQLDAQCAEPERQRPLVGHGQAGDMGHQPVLDAAVRHRPHDAEAGGIILPRIAPDEARQDVQQAECVQSPAWQREGGGGGKADGFHR